MAKIALLGATGSLGRALGRELSGSGQAYRAVSRSQMALQVRFSPDLLAEPMIWDSEQPASIRTALEDIETAVYLVGMPVWEFAKHLALTRLVLEAAKQTGVRRLLLVSSVWAYGAPQTETVSEAHPLAAGTAKGRIRREQEQMVLAANMQGGLETAVLRIADFYGPYVEASYLWSAFRGARNGIHAQLMSPADTPHEFAYVPDASRTALRMMEAETVWGRAWNLGGVGLTTLRSMAHTIYAEAGKPPDYETPSPWKVRLVAMMNPYIREMKEMQYLLENPVVLNDAALHEALGGVKKTAYAEGIRETLRTVRLGR